jgi:hypothetical protein
LKKTDSGYDFYEVKNAGKVHKQFIRDAAFQYYILSRCKIKVGKIYIVTHILHKDGYYKPEEIVLMPIPGSGSKEFLFCVKMYCEM